MSESSVEQLIEVSVNVHYLDRESAPEEERYAFAYTITLINHGSVASQLLNRHWIITDGRGDVQEVKGPGVIGQQPVLLPGQTFEYASACPLRTPRGKMRGAYGFVKLVAQTAEEYMDVESEGLETPDERLGRFRTKDTNDDTNDTNDTNDKQSPKSIFGDDEDFGVTFLKQPEDARFAVEIAEFGLDAEPEPET